MDSPRLASAPFQTSDAHIYLYSYFLAGKYQKGQTRLKSTIYVIGDREGPDFRQPQALPSWTARKPRVRDHDSSLGPARKRSGALKFMKA
jgi:hypothetical protein